MISPTPRFDYSLPNYSQVAPHDRVAFNSAAEAEEVGYRRAGNCGSCYRYSCLATVATSLLAEAFNARDSLRIILSVGDFSPLSSWLM